MAGVADADLEELRRDALGLGSRERQGTATLRFPRLAGAPEQSFAGHAERLLEAVTHAIQCEVGVELLDHRERLGGLAMRNLARAHRGLELQRVAFLAM